MFPSHFVPDLVAQQVYQWSISQHGLDNNHQMSSIKFSSAADDGKSVGFRACCHKFAISLAPIYPLRTNLRQKFAHLCLMHHKTKSTSILAATALMICGSDAAKIDWQWVKKNLRRNIKIMWMVSSEQVGWGSFKPSRRRLIARLTLEISRTY